jgi:futalosine hydrolase
MGILIVVPTETEVRLIFNGERHEDNEIALCGAGLVSAAANIARVLASRKPDAILLLGICGAYRGSHLGIGDVVRIDGSFLADFGAEERDGSLISPTSIGLGDPLWESTRAQQFPREDAGLRDSFLALPGVVSASVQTACGREETALDRVARSGAQVEEMEGAAIVAVASSLCIPVFHVRAVSNFAGLRDRDSWRIAEAARALGAWLGIEAVG